MARETQFASLDGTALYGDSNELHPRSNSLARRSVSIFSRRGTETPEPKPTFVAQAAMRIPKQMSEKQKRWMRRKSAPADGNFQPRGTILNAVPPAKTIKMTALEEEMATSPNEEILSAIGGTPITPTEFVWPTTPSSEHRNSMWDSNTLAPAERTTSKLRKERNARIGVWRNGVVHWDNEVLGEQTTVSDGPGLHETTGFSPLRRFPTERLNNPRPAKPMLSVVIPSSELLINDTSISTIVQPAPQRSVMPVAPLNVVSRMALGQPRVKIEEPQDDAVSPLDSPSPHRYTPPPKRPCAPIRASITGEKVTGQRRHRKSSSSTLSSSIYQDDDSDSGRESSATSFEIPIANNPIERASTSPEASPSCYSPCSEDEQPLETNKPPPLPLRSAPIPPPTRAAPAPPCSPIERMKLRQVTRKPVPPPRTAVRPPLERENLVYSSSRLESGYRDLARISSNDLSVCTKTPLDFDQLDEEPTSSPPSEKAVHDRKKQVECNGNSQNTSRETESAIANSGSLHRHGSVRSVLHPPERAPTIPRRSRRREWRISRNAERAVQLSLRTARRRKSESQLKHLAMGQGNSSVLRKSPSAAELSLVSDIAQLVQTPIESLWPPTPRIVIDDGHLVPNGYFKSQNNCITGAFVPSSAAEDVLLHILASLDSIKDLYNTARINKGMYRVFKENEMDLIRTVTYNQSAPAWELREWCVPYDRDQNDPNISSSPIEYSPESYISACSRDTKVIETLKKLILERCPTVIRRETAFALTTPSHPDAQRFNDAFWRIWSFCKIFGCYKGREEDVTGQLDWLKGGVLAHNQDLTATMNMNLDFDMGSVLLNPPDQFAKGNGAGLSARQLYDMTELLACMKTLLEGYHGRTEQAWDNGVFDVCKPGDGQSEEELLEEWTSYLLTLGPQVVVEMAELANNTSSAGFALAKVNGWTRWSQPEFDGSRSNFLKEPLSRLYEERVAAAAMQHQNSQEEEMKEMSRKRVATLAAEIKLARQSSRYRRLPYIDMSMERPMSTVSRRNSAVSSNSVKTLSSMSSMRRQPSTSSTKYTNAMSPIRCSGAPNFSVPQPMSPPPTGLWSPRKISPIIEDRVETFNRMAATIQIYQ